MKYVVQAIVLTLLLWTSTGWTAGPQGMEMGMSLAEVSRLGHAVPSKSRHVYTLSQERDGVAAYQLFITPVFGLCKILEVGQALDTRSDGDALRSAFSRQAMHLSREYGAYKKSEGFEAGAPTQSSSEWMADLAKEQRSLYAYWYEGAFPGLKDNLRAIKLEANGLSAERGYLTVAYEFRNFGDCLAEDEESARTGLFR